MLNCTCGRPLQFMEYLLTLGLPPTIKVGCPCCNIKFFVTAENVDVEEMPHMSFDTWQTLSKSGVLNIKGKTRKRIPKDSIQLVLL